MLRPKIANVSPHGTATYPDEGFHTALIEKAGTEEERKNR
jgi:hypothetical protein